jgi:serine/threonine protein kinase
MDDSPADRLLNSVIESQLHPPEATPTLDLLRTEFRDPDGLAREMVRREWLTEFQADRLLHDKLDELVLGPFALLEALGEGGMGKVYKARHRLMNRVVALKIIRTELLASPEARLRFQREIEAAARVWHPNLVAALDAQPVGDALVLVMEYVDGQTLARKLEIEGLPPIRHATEWARQAALGLGHAHEQGLIHRDVKPSNLMLTTRGNIIKVTDLGLARIDLLSERVIAGQPLTESGVVVGTPDYMAPEQAVSPRDAGPRSDLYGLGCTLYHLLTGRPPFPGGSLTQKLLWHQNAEPADPVRLRSSIPAGLARVVLKLMAKRPEHRFASATEVALALEAYCSAASLKTLPVDASRPPDLAGEPARTPVTPVFRHEPHEADPYDLAGPAEVGEVDSPAPPAAVEPAASLAKPARPDDDSWWKDAITADAKNRNPQETSAPAAAQSQHLPSPGSVIKANASPTRTAPRAADQPAPLAEPAAGRKAISPRAVALFALLLLGLIAIATALFRLFKA